MIGNPSCKFNARSPYLQCAVNPTGNCDQCQYFETRAKEQIQQPVFTPVQATRALWEQRVRDRFLEIAYGRACPESHESRFRLASDTDPGSTSPPIRLISCADHNQFLNLSIVGVETQFPVFIKFTTAHCDDFQYIQRRILINPEQMGWVYQIKIATEGMFLRERERVNFINTLAGTPEQRRHREHPRVNLEIYGIQSGVWMIESLEFETRHHLFDRATSVCSFEAELRYVP